MTNEIIKNEWKKMSRNLKKHGLNYTCVMNKRQIELRTATIMIDYIHDPEIFIANSLVLMNDENEFMKHARHDLSYMKRNRKTYDELFLPAAIRKLENNPESKCARDYYDYTVSAMKAYDEGTFLEWSFNYHKERIQRLCLESIERQKAEPSFEDQVKRSRNRFDELVNSDPVKTLMEAINATVSIEEVPDKTYTKVYARFSY